MLDTILIEKPEVAETPVAKKPTAKPVAKKKVTAKKKAKAKVARRITPPTKIKLLVKENPHRLKTTDHGKWRKLRNGQTLEAAVAAGCDRGYLRKLKQRELITIR